MAVPKPTSTTTKAPETQVPGTVLPTYGGTVGTVPAGTTYSVDPDTGALQQQLPTGYIGVGSGDDSGELTYINTNGMTDEEVRQAVVAIKGYGDWTGVASSPTSGETVATIPPGSVQNADGTWTAPDGTIIPNPTPDDPDSWSDEQNDLFAQYALTLGEFGLTGLDEFLKTAVQENWAESEFLIELRRTEAYLANPLFAANMERAATGGGFMSEGELIAYENEAKRLAEQYGFTAPSSTYIAQNILGGKSLAEFESAVVIQREVLEYGDGVRQVYENELGISLTDEDLWEMFNPEIDTQERNDAYKQALYRGRPVMLGLGERSEAEASLLIAMGVDPDEAYSRYETVAANADRFSRLGTIEQSIAGDLPQTFGDFSTVENSTLLQGLLYQDPKALAELQAITAREVARFKVGGGAAGNGLIATGLNTARS